MGTAKVRLTEAQRACLQVAAVSGAIISIRGGFWVSAATTMDARDALSNGTGGRTSWPAFVGTQTVYACERAGWLESNPNLPMHLRARRLTESGRAALAASRSTEGR